ncbi:MAG: single-stranded DNA-binding protein [Bdellovibrionia bacterium]
MKDVNKVILVGRLGGDPIQRQTKNGYPVTHFSLATSRKIPRTGDSDPSNLEALQAPTPPCLSQETQWHKIVVWGKQAQACAQFLRKGHSVYVEGMIRSHSYENKEGSKQTSFEIHSETVSFLSTPPLPEKMPDERRTPAESGVL